MPEYYISGVNFLAKTPPDNALLEAKLIARINIVVVDHRLGFIGLR